MPSRHRQALGDEAIGEVNELFGLDEFSVMERGKGGDNMLNGNHEVEKKWGGRISAPDFYFSLSYRIMAG